MATVMQNLSGIIDDLDQKWVLFARPLEADAPLYTLLWRTEGPKGRPLPRLGTTLNLPLVGPARIERIDPPGTFKMHPTKNTLVLRVVPDDDA